MTKLIIGGIVAAWVAMFVLDRILERRGYHTHHLDNYETDDDFGTQ